MAEHMRMELDLRKFRNLPDAALTIFHTRIIITVAAPEVIRPILRPNVKPRLEPCQHFRRQWQPYSFSVLCSPQIASAVFDPLQLHLHDVTDPESCVAMQEHKSLNSDSVICTIDT